MRCSMCNRIYDADSSRRSCGMCIIKDCGLSKCPYCRYENQKESFFARLFSKAGPEDKRLMVKIRRIKALDTRDMSKARKLLSLGVVPGKEAEIVQTFPAYILKIGEAKIVLDSELFSCIYFS